MRKILLPIIFSIAFAANSFAQVSLLHCHDKGWITNLTEGYSVLYETNCEVQEYLACGNGANIFTPQLCVAIIDNETCEPWSSPGFDLSSPATWNPVFQQNFFGQMNMNGSCGRNRPEKLFYWNQPNSSSMTALSNFLTTTVPDSSYILIYTWIISPNNTYGYPVSGSFAPWQSDILTTLQNLGFYNLDTINLSHPWIFLTKKGAPQSSQLVVGNTPDASIDLNAIICHPTPIISASSTAICTGGSAVLIAPPFLPGYLWSTGETTQVITVSKEGYYTVTINLNDSVPVTSDSVTNCFYTDSIFVDVVSCTGIEELESVFAVFPNPTKENITIKFNKLFIKQSQLNIYNLHGILRKNIVIPANKTSFDISVADLSAGVYFISLETENGKSQSQKVIIF